MKPRPLQRLILAAHATELKPFCDLKRKYLAVRGDTAYLAAGVGPVAATFGLTHFLEDFRPQEILAVGTAGIIDVDRFAIGEVVSAAEITTASGFAEAYTPRAQPSRIKVSTFRKENRKNRTALKTARVYCPQEITRNASWREELARSGHDVENLEAFAFAFVARKFKIPLRMFLGLTNVVGPTAHAQWLANTKTAVSDAARIVKPILNEAV